MSEPPLESFLARLYTDPELCARFLNDPANEAQQAGLSAQNCAAVLKINPTELRLAARSFAHKRSKRAHRPSKPPTLWQRWAEKFRR